MEVDKEDLEETETTVSFVEKTEVFDKVSATESTPPTDKPPPQVLESWIWYFNLRRKWIFFFKI